VRRSSKQMMASARPPAITRRNAGDEMKKQLLGIVLLALALCGCDQQAAIRKFVLPAQDKAGRAYFEDVRTGNFAPVYDATAPAYQAAMTPDLFSAMRAMFGTKPVKTITVIGARINARKVAGEPDIVTNVLTYEYDMGDRFVIAEIVLQDTDHGETGHAMQIDGIHVRALTRSLEQINGFTLSGKNPLFLAFLALVVLNPIFVIVTAVACWKTPIPRFKWLWRIFILFGVTGLTLNWTDGSVQFMPIMANFLGAAVSREGYGPWIFQIGIPLGAILFWIMRPRWRMRAEDAALPFA